MNCSCKRTLNGIEKGLVAVIVGCILLICAAVGAWLWPYTINTWLEYAEKDPCIKAWQGALMGFCPFLGQITVVAAIGTWLLMLFLG